MSFFGSAQRAMRRFGLEVRKNGPSARDDLRLALFLRQHRIDLVFDIGANRGQFARQLFANGYSGRIVSFEPLPAALTLLENAARPFGERWVVAPRVALCDKTGTVEFNINQSDATSSLLTPSGAAVERIPGIRTQRAIKVPSQRLDEFIDYIRPADRLFIKIDVQGGEGLVLAGAGCALDQAVGIVVELSLTSLYADQPIAFDILDDLRARGFEVYDIATAYRDPNDFRLHQIDVVMFHRDRLALAR